MDKRSLPDVLEREVAKESSLIAEDSLDVLREFERLEDEVPQ
ncbi:MAG: hypothetical protein WAP47_10535 [Candidatus Rokuibacteriota bacterium]